MIKRSMDVLDIYAWVKLRGPEVAECFVDNVYRFKYSWALKLKCRQQSKLLKVEPGQRVHFSTSEPPEKSVDNVARYLRSHVRGGRVVGVEMPWWERIVAFKTTKAGRELVHYVELVPRGLWVVVDSGGKILYASRFEEFRDRAIKPGLQYRPPPAKGIAPWSEDLVNALSRGKDLVRGVVSEWGLPGYIAEELLLRAGLYADKNKKPGEVSRSDLEKLAEEYKRVVEESTSGVGYLVYRDNNLEFYSPYKPRLFTEVYGLEARVVRDLDQAMDVYFAEYEQLLEAEERRRELEKLAESWRKTLEEQKRVIENYREELEKVRGVLNLIYGNYAVLQEALECAQRALDQGSWEKVSECKVLSSYDPRRGLIRVKVDSTEVELSVRKTLEAQVVELEKKRGELEKKVERALSVLRELENKSRELETELTKCVYAKPTPVFWYEKYRWSLTRNGFLVVAGRDASQNEVLVKKHLGERDVFLHADVHGAPATILFRGGGEPSPEDIEDAAFIAACYSRAWKAGYGLVEVYWVQGNQVSKAPPPGEYLSKGAFMVYGERNYLRVPLKLGIGLRLFCDEVYGEYVKVFVGPPGLVKKTCISYTVVIPGDQGVSEVAESIARILVEKAEEKTGVKYVIGGQQVQVVLPGPLRVIEAGVGEGAVKCED